MKYNSFLKLILFGFVCAVIATSCVKEGPMGPAGEDGKDGTNGSNGLNGTDGTTSCIVCHSSDQKLFAMENQWSKSGHGTLPDFERSEGECAICHTSQGFRGNLDGSYDWTVSGAKIINPNPQNCYTCHKIHETYTSDDLALTVSGPVELRNTGGKTHDFGKAGVCASCHQGRTVSPFPVVGGPDIVVTSSRYGVHHGPQANVVAGVGMGLFEIGNGLVNSAHSTQIANACVQCHMGEAFGTQSGGHTLWMAYEYHEADVLNTKGCSATGCHPAGENIQTLTEDKMAEISASLAELKVLLDAKGATKPGSDDAVKGTYPAEVAGALLDYKALTEDKSFGVHNPKYVTQLIENLKVAIK
jgi:mono/diheme cytochrome c family protein